MCILSEVGKEVHPLVAVMFLPSDLASLTLHFATPDEATVALFLDIQNHGLVSSAATQDLAAVHSPTGLVAQTSLRPQHTQSAEGDGMSATFILG